MFHELLASVKRDFGLADEIMHCKFVTSGARIRRGMMVDSRQELHDRVASHREMETTSTSKRLPIPSIYSENPS